MYANVEYIDNNETMIVDLHGLYVEEAKTILNDAINSARKSTKKVVVVHGYQQGTKLKDMVRTLRNGKISHSFADFYNKGQTIIVLK